MDFQRYVWGWETLISRYRVCSELAGSQSERVLTLAAHSVLPRLSLSRALPSSSPSEGEGESATLFQSAPSPCAFSAGGANHPRPRHPLSCRCRRRRPHPPLAKAPTELSLPRALLRADLPIFFFPFFFYFLFGFLPLRHWSRGSCRQYRPGLITFMSYSFHLLPRLRTRRKRRDDLTRRRDTGCIAIVPHPEKFGVGHDDGNRQSRRSPPASPSTGC